MTCYHPLTAYRYLNGVNENGKSIIRFNAAGCNFLDWEEIKLPCGKCIGCRLERSRQWAIRCVHEALLSEKSCFITLTYNDDHLHPSGSLRFHKKEFVDFMKRLRKHYAKQGIKIRYFHCGEYGELWQRPHHHAILFGVDFKEDRFHIETTKLGFPLYTSPTLEKIWSDRDGKPFGFVRIGECTFETVAYVARYVTKKINGEAAYDHYYGREPEYITMSRRPGIGYDWLFANPEIYNYDEIIIRDNLKCRPPGYYDRKFEEVAPDFMQAIKQRRKVKAIELNKNITFERLLDKEKYKELVTKRLIRNYEKNN